MSGHRGSERGGRFGTEIAVDKATHLLLETSVEAGLHQVRNELPGGGIEVTA